MWQKRRMTNESFKSGDEETTFEVFYVDNSEDTGKTYQYGFSLKKDESQKRRRVGDERVFQ